MDIKWGKQRREAFAKKESKLLVTAKGLEVSLHLVWDCLCRVASGLVAATFSSWAPLCSSACLSGELLGNSIAVSAVQALLASLVGSTWRVSVGVKTERKKCSPVSSWDRHVQRDAELVACWLGSSAAASTNRAVLGFSNNPCSSAWKGSDLAFASVHTGCFSNASCLPQNSVSESPNYLLRKPADCLHQACASRGRRQSFSERLCLPFSTEIDTVPLFPLLPLFFLYWELLDLDTVFSLMFQERQKQNTDFSWEVENVSWLGMQVYLSLGLFWTGIKSSWDLAQSHSWKIPF